MASMISTNCMFAHQLAEFSVSKNRRERERVNQTYKILQVTTYDVLALWTLIYTVVVRSPYRRMFQRSLACPSCVLFLSGSVDGSPYPNLHEAPIGPSFGPGVLECVPRLNCLNCLNSIDQEKPAVFTAYPSQTSPIYFEFNTPSDSQSVCWFFFVAFLVNQSKGCWVACSLAVAERQTIKTKDLTHSDEQDAQSSIVHPDGQFGTGTQQCHKHSGSLSSTFQRKPQMVKQC